GTLNAVIALEKVVISALNSNTDLFPGVETMMYQIMGMLKKTGREPLVLLYAPSSDRSSTVLMRQTDLIIEIAMTDESTSSRTPHHGGFLPYAR
ncbi:MAG: hypothetical protein LUQ36_00045, partial [Methanoregula sp.]|nr:hypothetical protein [Methanoregula sp.]